MNKEKKQKRVQVSKKVEEGLSYSVEVRDKEGRVIQRISAPSRSYVEQWNQLINVQCMGAAAETLKDTNGDVWADVPKYATNFASGAPIGDTGYGLRVGKGFTAVAIDDFALETPLEEGTGVDEFEHQAMTWTDPAVVGPTSSFTMKRIFVNNSGAPISGIRELGLYHMFRGGGGVKYALGFRDVLPGGVTVPDGGSITVIYTIAVTV